jgi:hypothetical protein
MSIKPIQGTRRIMTENISCWYVTLAVHLNSFLWTRRAVGGKEAQG